MKKMISVIIVFVLICVMMSPAVMAEEKLSFDFAVKSERKVFANASLEDEFADNRVMVVLSNEKSLEFSEYDNSDFSEVKCKAVTNITSATTQKVKQQVEQIKLSTLEKGKTVDAELISKVQKFNQVLCLELENNGKKNVLDAISKLENRDDVIYVGPDYKLELDVTIPNDTYYIGQTAINKIQLPAAWDLTKGSSQIKVGIIDTGIDSTHPELANKIDIASSRDFTTGGAIACTPTDLRGHGTHVAGIIGAKSNNNSGMSGACWYVTLVSLRVFNEYGVGYSSDVQRAIQYAESINIPILNFSAGYYLKHMDGDGDEDYYDVSLETVIANYFGLFVCSAGNNSQNNDEMIHYPSNYNLPNLISVGASTLDDTVAEFSNYGLETVDIFAPGESILSCYPMQKCSNRTCDSSTHYTNGYHYLSGTSMAAPYVTAVAALMLAYAPNLTAAEIKHDIIMRCDMIPSLYYVCYSGGRLNAYQTVRFAPDYYTLFVTSNRTDSIDEGEYLWYKFTATNGGYHLFYTEYTTSYLNVTGELFSEIVPNYSIEGRLVIEYDMYEPDDGNDWDENFCIGYYLNAGQTVYIRVSADEAGSYKIRVRAPIV